MQSEQHLKDVIIDVANFKDETFKQDTQIYYGISQNLSIAMYMGEISQQQWQDIFKEIPSSNYSNNKFISLSPSTKVESQNQNTNQNNTNRVIRGIFSVLAENTLYEIAQYLEPADIAKWTQALGKSVSANKYQFFNVSVKGEDRKLQDELIKTLKAESPSIEIDQKKLFLINKNLEDFATLIYEASPEVNFDEQWAMPNSTYDEVTNVEAPIDPLKGQALDVLKSLYFLPLEKALLKFYSYQYIPRDESGLSGRDRKPDATPTAWKAFYNLYLAPTEIGKRCLSYLFMKALHSSYPEDVLTLLNIWSDVKISTQFMARIIAKVLPNRGFSYADFSMLKSHVTLDVTAQQNLIVKLSDDQALTLLKKVEPEDQEQYLTDPSIEFNKEKVREKLSIKSDVVEAEDEEVFSSPSASMK